jgi:tellurite resistance protein TerC
MDIILSFLQQDFLGQTRGLWLGFLAIVLTLLFIDLGILNKKDEVISAKKSMAYAGIYVILATIFGLWVWNTQGAENGASYFTAYIIELTLSMDNLFVMSVILSYFAIPRKYQHRVLFWGIIGVLVMRAIMIGLGASIINSFSWVLLVFAVLLIITGIKMLFHKDDENRNLDDNPLIKFLQKHMRTTKEIDGHKFFIKRPHPETHKMVAYATPLFVALICIELMDLLFALDSVPAVLAITTNTFIVYTSNIFAILGLRSMYFALAAVVERFKYMKYALSIVLIFIGSKVFYTHYIAKIEPFVSLGITVSILIAGIVFSIIKTRPQSEDI